MFLWVNSPTSPSYTTVLIKTSFNSIQVRAVKPGEDNCDKIKIGVAVHVKLGLWNILRKKVEECKEGLSMKVT